MPHTRFCSKHESSSGYASRHNGTRQQPDEGHDACCLRLPTLVCSRPGVLDSDSRHRGGRFQWTCCGRLARRAGSADGSTFLYLFCRLDFPFGHCFTMGNIAFDLLRTEWRNVRLHEHRTAYAPRRSPRRSPWWFGIAPGTETEKSTCGSRLSRLGAWSERRSKPSRSIERPLLAKV